MHNQQLQSLLETYKEYAELFAKQIYNQDVWQEQTGCDVGEYFGYVECCQGRMYSFGTWYEHTQGADYPTGGEWDQYRDHKYSLLGFHA